MAEEKEERMDVTCGETGRIWVYMMLYYIISSL
jgi:hypothetical protein